MMLMMMKKKDKQEEDEEYDCWFVVDLLFYVHGKHLRSCQDGQLT